MPYFDVKLRGQEGAFRIPENDDEVLDDLALARVYAEKRWGPSQILSIEHALVCRSCGQDEFIEWEDVPYYNYVKLLGIDEHGNIEIDYEGVSGSGDGGGGNQEFWCVNCDDSAETLEELVGLPLVVNHACPVCGSTELSAKIDLKRHYSHVTVLEDGTLDYEGFGDQIGDEVRYLECENDHVFQPTEHRLVVAKSGQTV